MWDEIGALQFEYVRAHGLAPDMYFLDVGCGCLRGGVHFIRYLDARRYHGIDLSEQLLDVGFKTELGQAGLQHKLPRENLRCTDGFDATDFGVDFDMALALSVFTHLTLNHLKLSLIRLAKVIKPGGRFFVTVFHSPDSHDWSQPLLHTPGDITTYPDRDPFHYCRDDLVFREHTLPWRLEELEQWNHPRDQWMAVFVRTEDTA
ncbi:class I SAM-dependent methyltransferase [Gemmatimonadota bacterium]